MDGTLYLDDRLFDGVKEFLARIREKGGRYLFLTNNSSRGVESYMEKLGGMGIQTERRDYLTSVDAAIDCLRRRYPGKRCYVQGTRSFYGQLAAAGGAARRGVWAVQEQRGRANVGGLAAFVGPSSGGWRSVNARRARIFAGVSCV